MPDFKCYPISNPKAQWLYCPSYPAAIFFASLFGLTTVAHIVQALLHKKPFAAVLIMGAVWEFIGYIFRTLSVEHQLNETYGTVEQLLILLAPLWINAFVYMVLGRMAHFFLADDRLFGIKARKMTLIFVLCDICSFVVQAVGGLMTTPSASPSTQKLGLHVYMGGVGLQLLFISIFIALAGRFQILVSCQKENSGEYDVPLDDAKLPRQAHRLLYAVYAVLTLIIYRNIYRLIEFSAGVESKITTHEWYTFVFDSLPMFLALIVFNIFHPGRTLRGPNCDFSEESKALKEAKKAKKAEKKQQKQEKGMAKDMQKREKIFARLERKQQKKKGSELKVDSSASSGVWQGYTV